MKLFFPKNKKKLDADTSRDSTKGIESIVRLIAYCNLHDIFLPGDRAYNYQPREINCVGTYASDRLCKS